MSGVETAVFANDVCGAPIPWNMCLPWQFFDGKLFHFKLLKATNNTPLIDMCDGQVRFVNRNTIYKKMHHPAEDFVFISQMLSLNVA